MSEETNSDVKKINGLVAQVISSRELVINIGSEHGVKKGMRFAVLAATPIEIHDPSSGKLLDVVDREKVRVEAQEVRPKITICRTYRKKRLPGGPLYLGGIIEASQPPRTEFESLSAAESSYPEPLAEEDSYVKNGDRVYEVDDPD